MNHDRLLVMAALLLSVSTLWACKVPMVMIPNAPPPRSTNCATLMAYTTPSYPAMSYTRKAASAMSVEEIARFKAAWEMMMADPDQGHVRNSILSCITQEHGNFTDHYMHTLMLGSGSLLPMLTNEVAGNRFLAWHRAYLLVMEAQLRAADCELQGGAYCDCRPCTEDGFAMADVIAGGGPTNEVNPDDPGIFLPYWDWVTPDGEGRFPDWVDLDNWNPKGTQASRDGHFPKAHPASRVRDGQWYTVRLNRFPGKLLVAPKLPDYRQVNYILEQDSFWEFTQRLEWSPAVIYGDIERIGPELDALGKELKAGGDRKGAQRVAGIEKLLDELHEAEAAWEAVEDRYFALLLKKEEGRLNAGERAELEELEAMRGRVDHLSKETARKYLALQNHLDAHRDSGGDVNALGEPMKRLPGVYLFGPHGMVHLWIGGAGKVRYAYPDENRETPSGTGQIRGTTTYFNETAADPLFWMLHAQVDRLWYAWEARQCSDGTTDCPLPPHLKPNLPDYYTKWPGHDPKLLQPVFGGPIWSAEQLATEAELPYSYDTIPTDGYK